jgi:ATP-dependent DNA helicase RecQ
MTELRNGDLDLLYMAPERLFYQGGAFLEYLKTIDISLIAIDETHCISQWGHDFRPDYVQLGQLKSAFPKVPMIALTATADSQTRDDILAQLRMDDPRIFLSSFDRPNIKYTVRPKKEWFEQLLTFLENKKKEHGIIYCLSRKSTEQLAENLRENGIQALAYHAGLPSEQRADHQEKFLKDEVQVIVATIAFGMGIDKSNVRFVIHVDLPKNIEGYYQETGRAGRDGLDSDALLFYGAGDYFKLSRFCEVEGNPEQTQILLNKLRRMVDFADSRICRRKNLLNYFGEAHEGNCGNCDNCLTTRESYDGTVEAQKLLSTIARLEQAFGLAHIVDILRGSQSEKISSTQRALSTYGIGKELSKVRWMEIGKEMIQLGLIEQSIGRFPTLSLNDESWKILKGEKSVSLTASTEEKEVVKKALDYDAVLFDALREERLLIAKELNSQAYMILSDNSLRELSIYYPTTEDDLHFINGFGQVKVNRFGARFLKVINEHLASAELKSRMDEKRKGKARKVKKTKEKGGPSGTVIETLTLYSRGKKVEEIAEERNLKETTVLNHLAEGIRFNKLKIEALMEPARISTIAKAFKKHPDQGLNPVKEALGDDFSYGELRLVQAELLRAEKA